MSNPFKTQKFKLLQREWYLKLAQDGFKDIETTMGSGAGFILKKSGTEIRYQTSDALTRSAKQTYFEILSHKVETTVFEDDLDRQIMTYLKDGMSKVEMSKRIQPPRHRATIYKRMNKYLRAWGLK